MIAERFWSHVDIGNPTICWPWRTVTEKHVRFFVAYKNGRRIRDYAHRIAYQLKRGAVPNGLHVLHTCDVRHCCNPRHLFLGTNQDNIEDKMAKGRQNKGVDRWNAKLNDDKVRDIRKRAGFAETNAKIGADYGVSQSVISNIRNRKTWKHV